MNKNNCNEYIYNRYDGIITTYKKIRDKEYLCIETGLTICFDHQLLLGKTSENIIDLIESGDYVNGKLIHHTDIRKNSAYIYYGNGKTFVDYQINSIVTKEQFKAVEYKVGD